MIVMQSVVAASLIVLALPAAAAIGQGPRPAISAANAQGAAPSRPPQPGLTRRTPFTNFGAKPVLELRGDSGTATVDFGSRADELVTKAVFHIRYAYSPDLVPGQAHIRLTLNGEVIGILPVTAQDPGKTVTRDVEVNPSLIVGFNKLALSLVAPRAAGPADAARPGPWADVSGSSELEVGTQPLVVADDLALLPEPFFDRRDQRRLRLPFVFGAQPSRPALRAAATVASWFGHLAAWRGARFPAHLGEAAAGHSIAFATNDERPAFLASLPPAAGPVIRIMTNPADGRSRMLLLLGRDGSDLEAAADALVLGSSALSGASVNVKGVREAAPRRAYDAPGWVRMDGAMKLGELIGWPQQLQASGNPPDLDPIRVDLRMPPDLAAWRSPGVPMTLKFHYTPPACAAESHLDVSINDELLKVVALRTANREGDAAASRRPLPAAIADRSEIVIPAFRLRSRNQLQFGFRFPLRTDGDCRGEEAGSVRAVVDADSSIDFSGFPHYARMPDLGHFVSAGFPFTEYADLSRTVVVLPDRPSAQDIETLLTLMGRMGESTGLPATGVRIAGARDEAPLADADILIVGAAPQPALLDKWGERLPVVISGPVRRVSRPASRAATVYEWLGFGGAPDTTVATQVEVEQSGPLAAILGFESPVTSGRSVVAVTATTPELLLRVLDDLEDPELARSMRGSAVVIHPDKVDSVLVGPTYAIGFLPPWAGLGYRLREHPGLASALGVAVLALLAFVAWRARMALAAWGARRRA